VLTLSSFILSLLILGKHEGSAIGIVPAPQRPSAILDKLTPPSTVILAVLSYNEFSLSSDYALQSFRQFVFLILAIKNAGNHAQLERVLEQNKVLKERNKPLNLIYWLLCQVTNPIGLTI